MMSVSDLIALGRTLDRLYGEYDDLFDWTGKEHRRTDNLKQKLSLCIDHKYPFTTSADIVTALLGFVDETMLVFYNQCMLKNTVHRYWILSRYQKLKQLLRLIGLLVPGAELPEEAANRFFGVFQLKYCLQMAKIYGGTEYKDWVKNAYDHARANTPDFVNLFFQKKK